MDSKSYVYSFYDLKIYNVHIFLFPAIGDDLEHFDWQVFKVEKENDDDDEAADSGDESICHNFEVKTSQEQKEDFEFSSGFNVSRCFTYTIRYTCKKNIYADFFQ